VAEPDISLLDIFNILGQQLLSAADGVNRSDLEHYYKLYVVP